MSVRECPFCQPAVDRVFHEGDFILGLWDGFPVSPGHALLVPRRHVATWEEASPEERNGLFDSIVRAQAEIRKSHQPDGFNIGMNQGLAGGQTVPHLHLHVIPRYAGDVGDPRGGVRWVVPACAEALEQFAPNRADLGDLSPDSAPQQPARLLHDRLVHSLAALPAEDLLAQQLTLTNPAADLLAQQLALTNRILDPRSRYPDRPANP